LGTQKHLSFELGDSARQCSDADYRFMLKAMADYLDGAVSAFCVWPTEENLRSLNDAWAAADRVLKNTPTEADPQPPVAGSPEVARLSA
jgi:hypothetical protein